VQDIVKASLQEAARLLVESIALDAEIVRAAEAVAETFAVGGKLYIFGNGGSAADAQHLAAEFINRFQIERPPLPAAALTTDTSVLTAIANDYSFQDVFAKQIKALGRPEDAALGLTTSGTSANVISALSAAKRLGMKTLAMTGAGGGEARGLVDVLLAVDSVETPRIQEVHIIWGHVICALVDYILFKRPGEALVE
jgi:D-sedoheptulose 7-phosphate isomerase